MEMAQQSISTNKSVSEHRHLLSDKWVLWAHLPHDTDWTLKSYINKKWNKSYLGGPKEL